MRKMKTRAGRSRTVAASSLDASQEEPPTPLAPLMPPLPVLVRSAEAVCLRSGINLPASTRHSGKTTFQCKFVKVLVFFFF